MANLTPKQQKSYDFIRDFSRDYGYPPTVREIGEHLGLKSPSTVKFHLDNLRAAGLIQWDGGKTRSITLLEKEDELYILVHAGIRNFDPMKELDEYEPIDFLWERLDYSRRYFPSERIFLVTGHTPTQLIGDGQPLVYQNNGHIAIDCGCVFGGKLAAYCIETGTVTYAESRMRRE
jgi:DNA-binding transcriptional ArsR family regulator